VKNRTTSWLFSLLFESDDQMSLSMDGWYSTSAHLEATGKLDMAVLAISVSRLGIEHPEST
jgi:hypothetical protein